MRLIKAAELARTLGIPPATMRAICQNDPELAVMKDGAYFIRVEELATRPGFDLVAALMLPTKRWVKAVDVAAMAGKPRRTVAHWCLVRPRFAKRIGRIWYIDVEALGASDDEMAQLSAGLSNNAQNTSDGQYEN